MLPCVCSVIDHRWRQNVVRTKKWHTRRSRVCHWCSYHTLTFSVIYNCIRRTAIWNLFVLSNNEKPFYFKICQHNAKAGLLPRLGKKKAIWRDLWSIQNEAISSVAMRSKVLWLVEKNRATVKPTSSVAPCWMKTYSESRIELRNLQILKMLEKSSQFLSSEQPGSRKARTLPWKLQELKTIPSENLWLRSTKKPLDSSFEWKERKWRFLSSVVGDSGT